MLNRNFRPQFFLAVWLIGSVLTAAAQTTQFTYQGKLTDGGNPANGIFDLQFALFDALSGGTQQGALLNREDVVVTSGVFTVSLDFGACPTCFNGAARWLEISVRPGASTGLFTVLSPRQSVAATPYAIRSLSAANADAAANAANATNATTAVNFSGALGGDVTGNQGATTVGRLQNIPLPAPVQADHKSVLRYENDGVIPARFVLSPDENSGGTITGVTVSAGLNGGGTSGTVNIAIGPGGVSTAQLADSGVTTPKLADGSVIDAKIATVAGNKITGTIPVAAVPAGSGSYVQNTTTPQTGTNFNISGNGTVGGELRGNIISAGQFNLGLLRVLSGSGSGTSLFVGIGAGSMNHPTLGFNNTFVGAQAGEGNQAGFNNSFFGHSAGALNTSGDNNAFFGAYAGNANTTGNNNAFFGYAAGNANTASHNAFFGYQAGQATTAGDNAFFGANAGGSNTSGNDNSFFGSSAGLSNTTGIRNSFFGTNAGDSNTMGFNNSLFGGDAGQVNTTGSNNSFFGTFTGNSNTEGSLNSFFGEAAGGANTTGNNNSFFGRNAGNTNTTGDNNTIIGYGADVASGNLSYATAIGADAVVSTSNTVVLGRSDDIVRVPGFLRVVQLGSPGVTPLCQNVNDTISTCSSSLRYKTNIQRFGLGLSLVNRLKPISFDWKEGGMNDVGFGAEDVAKLDPRFVTYNNKGEVEGVKYDRLSVVLINAVKEQQAQIAAQQKQIEELQKLVCRTQRRAKACQPAQR